MNCPNCNTVNPAGNQFCMNCGASLSAVGAAPITRYSSLGHALFTATGQTLISVLMLYLLRSILNGLSFIQELQIPEWRITAPEIISIIMYLLVLVLLVNYARSVAYLWPQAYPRYSGVGIVITAILYVIGLSVAYTMLKPLFQRFFTDPEPLLILRVLLALIALFLLGRAAVVVYQSLPGWLDNLRTSLMTLPSYPIEKKE